MASEGSITRCILMLKAGDREAAQKLWDAYFQRLVGLARARLRNTSRRATNEEDVALSAFDSFYRRAEQGRFPRLFDRNDLWQLLLMITVRKAIDLMQYERRRGGGRGKALTDMSELNGREVEHLTSVFGPSDEPSPEAVVIFQELTERLLGLLDDKLRTVARMKLDGYNNREIAETLGCHPETIRRKHERICHLWAGECEVAS